MKSGKMQLTKGCFECKINKYSHITKYSGMFFSLTTINCDGSIE